jgi:ABC-2 type transport system permease protein
MGIWRLEWLRLTRTPRLVALLGVFVFFGLLGPVTATYLPDIVANVQSGMTIIVPPPQPRDGIINYVSQAGQIGLIVLVAISAGAMGFDSRPGLSIFLRSRVGSMWQLVRPRIIVVAAAGIVAYGAGLLSAWFETAVLLGPLDPAALLAGLFCQAVYLLFVVAVVTAAASLARSTPAILGIALGSVIALSVIGGLGLLHDWLPTTLAGAQVALLGTTTLVDYLPAIAASLIATAALIAAGVHRLARRET